MSDESDEDLLWLEDEYPNVYHLLRAIEGDNDSLHLLRDEDAAFHLVARAARGKSSAVRDAESHLEGDDDWLDHLFDAVRDDELYSWLGQDGDRGLIGLFFAAVRDELDDPRQLQRRSPRLAQLADLLKDEFTLYPDDEEPDEDDFDEYDPDEDEFDEVGLDEDGLVELNENEELNAPGDQAAENDQSQAVDGPKLPPSSSDQIAAWNFALVTLAVRRGDSLTALNRLTRSIMAKPSAPAYRERAQIHRALGNDSEALADEERAGLERETAVPDAGDRPVDAAFNSGMVRLGLLKRPEEAIEPLTRSLEASPSARAYLARGDAFRGCGRAAEAAADEQRAEEMLLAALRQVAEQCITDGNLLASFDDEECHEGAVEWYSLAIATDPTPDAYRRRAEAYRKLGQADRAAEDDRAAGAPGDLH